MPLAIGDEIQGFLGTDQAASEKRLIQVNEHDEMRLNAYENARIYKERTKTYHDKNIVHRSFEPSQLVLLFNSKLRLFPGKLKSRWSGPFMVKEVSLFGSIEVQEPELGRTFKVNGQRLKLYLGGGVDRQRSCISLSSPP
ncbi:uncharacterized protein LOC113874199 [Abrus precatorius]|uniref:Uncharacterized protein LOC113874199 n=1 Tax=Abrus precatorius TaxID=3816 RepID=A0A8B8MJZ0_ABRPR|nr:uncharacterized protein LOC113874199 [Abrus precatorius]